MGDLEKSEEVEDAKVADVWLGRIGIVAHHCSDVVAGDRGCHFRAKLLIHMVDANLAKFIAAFCAGKNLQCAKVGVEPGEHIAGAWNDERGIAVFEFSPAVADIEMLPIVAVGAEFRPDVGMDRPSYASAGGEFSLVGCVAENHLAVAHTEIAPAEAFHVAIAHGELEHERGDNPLTVVVTVFERDIPLLDLRELLDVGADIARHLTVVGRQFDLRNLPVQVGVVVANPAGEDALECVQIAPDGDRLQPFASGEVENPRKTLAGEVRDRLLQRNRRHLAEPPDADDEVADCLFSGFPDAQTLNSSEFRVLLKDHLNGRDCLCHVHSSFRVD